MEVARERRVFWLEWAVAEGVFAPRGWEKKQGRVATCGPMRGALDEPGWWVTSAAVLR